MKVIVDASVWSLALRRSNDIENEYVEELEELIKEVRAQLIGPVRQELLNGIKSEKQYKIGQGLPESTLSEKATPSMI